jgi:hypothetical protein
MDIHADADVAGRSASTSGSGVVVEGITAGVLGAATVAVWFLIVDAINGHPLYTPTVLGTALFRGGAGLESAETLPISFEMVTVFTWVHLMVFALIGGAVARLLAFIETAPNSGFGVLLLFVLFSCGFVAVSTSLAGAVLLVLGEVAVFVGNLLAAAVMVAYFRRRHPGLRVLP